MLNVIKKVFYIGSLIIMSLIFSGSAFSGERCSPTTGQCFEWPLAPHGTTLERIRTDGVWSKPEGNGPFPAIVIAESCGGAGPTIDKFWPNYFNEMGFATYTPRVLEQLGERRCPNAAFVVSPKNRLKMIQILYSALDELRNKNYVDKSSIGVIGFSLGAINISDAGEINDLKSPAGNKFKYAINVYGYCNWLERKGDNIPTLMLLAEKDTERGKRAICLEAQKKNFYNVIWHEIAGAYHAFDAKESSGKTDPGGNKMKYSAAATKEAQEVIKEFLSKYK